MRRERQVSSQQLPGFGVVVDDEDAHGSSWTEPERLSENAGGNDV
jgi:hypothetical protein